MPVLDKPRYERFAQCLASGMSASAAYVEAGYLRNDGNAGRLNRNEQILNRVAELQSRTAQGLQVTRDWLMEKAEEAREMAMKSGNPSAAIAAVKELGILSSLRVEKRENMNRSLDQMSDDELAAIATGSGEGAYSPSRSSSLSH